MSPRKRVSGDEQLTASARREGHRGSPVRSQHSQGRMACPGGVRDGRPDFSMRERSRLAGRHRLAGLMARGIWISGILLQRRPQKPVESRTLMRDAPRGVSRPCCRATAEPSQFVDGQAKRRDAGLRPRAICRSAQRRHRRAARRWPGRPNSLTATRRPASRVYVESSFMCSWP